METLTPIKRLVLGVSVVVMALFGFVGYAAAAPVIETHGPNSGVRAGHRTETVCRVVNTTNISATNNNSQTARSGDVTIINNTNAGAWSGWSQLSPVSYQAAGYSFASWRADVLSWLSERQSGDGWNAATDVVTISGGADWNSWDPITWQQSGQTFATWRSELNVHLNSSYTGLESSWPPEATATSPGTSRSGSASNFSSFTFTVGVNNTPSSTTVCSSVGGRGGPETPSAPQQPNNPQPSATVQPAGGQGGGSGGGGGGSWSSAPRASSPAPRATASPSTPSTPQQPNNPSNPGSSGGSITTHGPNSPVVSSSSSSTRTTITNTTNISATNNNPQTASSGGVNAANNTSVGGGSGGASNNANGAVTMNVRQ